MDPVSKERQFITDFTQTTQDYFTTHADYESVDVLLLYWDEDDLGVEKEVRKVKELFEGTFRFGTRVYQIPSQQSTSSLNIELCQFIMSHSLGRRSLIILYYAGHADDAESSSPPGYSEWRA